MATAPKAYARVRNSECFEKIQQLRRFYGDSLAAQLLGLKTVALGWGKQPIPVVRLAYVLWLLTFHADKPTSIFDLLTLGKYSQTPQAALPAPAPA